MTRDVTSSDTTTQSSSRMRWGRILAGAFLLEFLLIVVLVPPLQILGPEKVVPFVFPVVIIFSFGVAWWMLRKAPQRAVIHATLIGAGATAIYILLCLVSPDGLRGAVAMYGPGLFVAGNGLRIVACAAGGYVLQRKLNVSVE
jgi:hypothetical protein